MTRSTRLFAIILPLLLITVLSFSLKPFYAGSSTTVHLRFLDATTQLAVLPERVDLKSGDGSVFIVRSGDEISQGKPLSIDLSQGAWSVEVISKGYKPMAFAFDTKDQTLLNYTIRLDSKLADPLVNYSVLKNEERADKHLIIGYVADWDGNPLQNVRLDCPGTGEFTTTDDRGYYRLSLNVDVAAFYSRHKALSPEQAILPFYRTLALKKDGYNDLVIENELIHPYGNGIASHRMQKGEGITVMENTRYFDLHNERSAIGNEESVVESQQSTMKDRQSSIVNRPSSKGHQKSFNQCIPQAIVVGFTPNGTTCCSGSCSDFNSDYGVFSLDEYSKHILRGEWLTTWNALPNMDEAYKAAAVAIRSYAMARMLYNPSSEGFYQICSNACCQNFFIGSIPSYMSDAVDATSGVVMLNGNQVGLTEYSSENNGLDNCHCVTGCGAGSQCSQTGGGAGCFQSGPCGDGFFQDVATAQCVADPVGTGHRQFGHGRGMSQYGSARWASGINLNAACESGPQPDHGLGLKNWQEILTHYYPNYNMQTGFGICELDCTNVVALACDVQVSGNTANGSNNILTYGCNISNNYTGPELVYSVNMAPGAFTVTLSNISFPPNPANSVGLAAIVLDGSAGCQVLDDPNNGNSNCIDVLSGAGNLTIPNPNGGTYFIVVDGLTEVPFQGSSNNYDENNGSFDLLVSGPCSDCPHGYDAPCSALAISPGQNCMFTGVQNFCATTSVNPLPEQCAGDVSENDIWLKTTAGIGGRLIIDTDDGSLGDVEMAAYTGTNCSALTLIGCFPNGSSNDPNGWMPYAELAGLLPGENLWIRLWDFGIPHEGTFSVCVVDPDVGIAPLTVCPTLVLEGAFDPFHASASVLMRTSYAANGSIPLAQPYQADPWNYLGGEAFASASSVPADMVDWVLVGLRDGGDPNVLFGRKAGVLHADGSVDMPDGSPMTFVANFASGYFIEIMHHGHLSVISALPQFPDANGLLCHDFTVTMSAAYRNQQLNDDPMSALNSLSGIYHALSSGNVQNLDCQVDANDVNLLFFNYGATGFYGSADTNMDGVVDINDLNLIFGKYNQNCHLNY